MRQIQEDKHPFLMLVLLYWYYILIMCRGPSRIPMLSVLLETLWIVNLKMVATVLAVRTIWHIH